MKFEMVECAKHPLSVFKTIVFELRVSGFYRRVILNKSHSKPATTGNEQLLGFFG